ncbi:unnamed protein product [Discosporangium mesarthrocarpum]
MIGARQLAACAATLGLLLRASGCSFRDVPGVDGALNPSEGLPKLSQKSTFSTSQGATSLPDSEKDDFLTFCVDFDRLPSRLTESQDFRVVAVTGCQCSGKSTLLNAIFGTGFPVMESSNDPRPQRTTIGAWVDIQELRPDKPRKKRAPIASTVGMSVKNPAAEAQEGPGMGVSRSGSGVKADAGVKWETWEGEGEGRGEGTRTRANPREAHWVSTGYVDNSDGRSAGAIHQGAEGLGAVASNGAMGQGECEGDAVTGKGEAGTQQASAPVEAVPFVLIDIEGTQSRARGAESGVFDSR